MSNSDINPLRLPRMHRGESGGLSKRWYSKSTGVSAASSPFSLPLKFHGAPKTLVKVKRHGLHGSRAGPGPKFGLSSIVGPHIWSNTESYGILCLPTYSQHEGTPSSSSYAAPEFRREGWASPGFRDWASKRESLSLALSELTSRTRMVNPTMSSQSTRRCPPVSSISGEKCTSSSCKSFLICACCGKPQQAQICNDSIDLKFADGDKGLREWVNVYHETLISSDSELGVTMSRHVRAKTSGEQEVFIAKLINRDCTSYFPRPTSGLEEWETGKSKHGELSNGSSSHSKCSRLGYDKAKAKGIDNQSFPDVNPKRYSFGWEGESSHALPRKSAPIKIPKRKTTSTLSDDDAALCPEERISYAYSMTEGVGRTLKGRDLFQVRNYVLRLTGFIED